MNAEVRAIKTTAEQALVSAFVARRVDGLIIFSRMPDAELEWLAGLDKPLVFFGRLPRIRRGIEADALVAELGQRFE